jgi:hypothetical protein
MTRFSTSEKYRAILFPASLHHCPADSIQILKNAYDNLEGGGVVGFIEPNLFHPYRLAMKVGLARTLSPGEAPLNPYAIDRYLRKGLNMERHRLEFCSVFPSSASKMMRYQNALSSMLGGVGFLAPVAFPWFFGVYRKR